MRPGGAASRPTITHAAAPDNPTAMPIAIQSQFGRTLAVDGTSAEGGATGWEYRLGTEPRSRSASAFRRASRISDTANSLPAGAARPRQSRDSAASA